MNDVYEKKIYIKAMIELRNSFILINLYLRKMDSFHHSINETLFAATPFIHNETKRTGGRFTVLCGVPQTTCR